MAVLLDDAIIEIEKSFQDGCTSFGRQSVRLLLLKIKQLNAAREVCTVCNGKGFVLNTHGINQFCISCDGTGAPK